MSTRRRLLAIPVASALFLILGASSCEQRGTRDAPIDVNKQDNTAPYIVNGPDQYHNQALKCFGADLDIAHTRAAPPVVVKDASFCKPGVAESIGIPRVGGYAGSE